MKHQGYGGVNLGNPNYHYKYNGKELQENSMYDYGARLYMPDIGRWSAVDPLVEKRFWLSPYNYVQNNPIYRIDPTGMLDDDYIFNENGQYIRTDKTNIPDRLVIENSQTKERTFYQFNDLKTDVSSIKYNIQKFGSEFSNHQFVFVISKDWLSFFKGDSDIYHRGYLSRYLYASIESIGGKMDAAMYNLSDFLAQQGEGNTWNPIKEILKDKGPLYIFQGDGYQVYNHMDAGNFLWGNYMRELGFSLIDTINAAKTYNKNDSDADLRAIRFGYLLNNTSDIFVKTTIKNINE